MKVFHPNTFVIPGNPFLERLAVWGDQVAGYAKTLDPMLVPRVVVRVTYYLNEPGNDISLVTSELIEALVGAGVIAHIGCVVEVNARMLPAIGSERCVISVDPHWTAQPGQSSRWDNE